MRVGLYRSGIDGQLSPAMADAWAQGAAACERLGWRVIDIVEDETLRQARGYWGRKHSSPRLANEQLMRSGQYAYRDRRRRKRDVRRLWIVRINAAARLNGLSYSRLMAGLKAGGVEVNRKILADLAVRDADAFARLAEVAKAHQ